MNSEPIKLDLRGKTQADVIKMTEEHGLYNGHTSDITHLHHSLSDKYVSVICVWLRPIWEVVKGRVVDKDQPKATFVLWSGKEAPQRYDCDLHGFVKPDGSIDWGQCHTMNLMR